MRSRAAWIGVVGAAGVGALACGLALAGAERAPSVSGRVVDADGAGLAADLLVLALDNRLLARRSTNADGTFAFELPDGPVQIVPDRRSRGLWEFEPAASRVSGGFLELEFTGYHEPLPRLRGRLTDAASGEPLANALVTIRRTCPADAADPAARYRQSPVSVVRTDDRGRFGVRCSVTCGAILQSNGDAAHPAAHLEVAAGDCASVHELAAAPR